MEDLVKPVRYNSHPSGVECKEISNKIPGVFASITRYLYRWEHKDPAGSLKKALVYLGDIETEDFKALYRAPLFPHEKVSLVIMRSEPGDPLVTLMKMIGAAYMGQIDEAPVLREQLQAEISNLLEKVSNGED